MLVFDFVEELEKRFSMSNNETERHALSVVLEKEYRRIQNMNLNQPEHGLVEKILYSKKLRPIPEEMQFQFDYIAEVIDGCKNVAQLDSCRNMIDSFYHRFGDGSKSCKPYVMKRSLELRIQKTQLIIGL